MIIKSENLEFLMLIFSLLSVAYRFFRVEHSINSRIQKLESNLQIHIVENTGKLNLMASEFKTLTSTVENLSIVLKNNDGFMHRND